MSTKLYRSSGNETRETSLSASRGLLSPPPSCMSTYFTTLLSPPLSNTIRESPYPPSSSSSPFPPTTPRSRRERIYVCVCLCLSLLCLSSSLSFPFSLSLSLSRTSLLSIACSFSLVSHNLARVSIPLPSLFIFAVSECANSYSPSLTLSLFFVRVLRIIRASVYTRRVARRVEGRRRR